MAFRTGAARMRRPAGRRVLVGLGVIVAAIVLLVVFANIWTNVLWYRSLGYGGVYGTMVASKVVLFLLGAVLLGGSVLLNLSIARRSRPLVVPNTPEQQALARYRSALEPFLTGVAVAVAALVGLIGGLTAVGAWQTVLAFMSRTPFGTKDPQFGIDASFYVFTYPFLRLLLDFGFATIVLGAIAGLVVHYLFGGLRVAPRGRQISAGARAHLCVLLGLFMVLKAIGYWLDRYGLVLSGRGVVEGASYTDVHAVLPAKTILAGIALFCALLFFVSVARRGMLLAGLSLGLLVLSALLIGGVYPAAVQQLQVKPNEAQKERPYIARNIGATRTAYGLDAAKVTPYDAKADVGKDEASAEQQSPDNIRLVDPNVVSATFQQLQQIRAFYSFSDTLDVDRYTVKSKEGTSIVAVRELPSPPEDRRNWVNDHLVYTHGFGFVSAEGNAVDSDGKPVFQVGNIPPTGDLGKFEPRVYFGEKSPPYSIVGAPGGETPAEFDYASESQSGQQNNTYKGRGGVDISSFGHRLLFAVKFGDINILLSDGINQSSKVLYDRSPRERVQKAAPYLELDGDPYPALVNGRIVWIVDGYTKSDKYPYSQSTALDQATQDSLTGNTAHSAQPDEQVNYLRNSVKATVDAYDGTVTLYAWDTKDPVLKTWQKVFPNTLKPRSAMSAELLDHVRYPEDLFKAQREMLARYHVTDPGAFYGGQDFWSVPDDPTRSDQKVAQPPYYLLTRMPGEQEATFSLTSTLVPRNRPNLAAFVSVSSDPGKDYGRFRVLQLPRDTAVPGPGTVQGNFKAYAPASEKIALLDRGGSNVTYGNLLTLPYAGGLLYVEPLYVRASAGESYPLLQYVLVSFGTKIGFAPTLGQALDQVLGTDNGGGDDGGGDDNGGGSGNGSGTLQAQLNAAIADAQSAYEDGQAALKKGDFTAYGKAQTRLKDALDRAASLQKRLGGKQPSGTPSPGASGSATPSGGATPSSTGNRSP